MSDESDQQRRRAAPSLSEQIGKRAQRKLKARRHSPQSVWFGLGMMGLIGWSVAVPTLSGAALGLWLDHHHPGKHAWTLAFLAAGLAIGCMTAWHWVASEEREIREEQERNGE
ncbi:MAG TPA: AtpZ/AtpI family protein [Steroidobacteraceae bacterium]|nr:AtpZ/AtpI family protein [Steroidobacteraceae bacterium]